MSIFQGNDLFNERDLYFIIEGEIIIYFPKDENHIFKRLNKEDYFGEYNFITGNQNGMSAKSMNHSALFTVSYSDFYAIIKENQNDYVFIIRTFRLNST